MGFEEIVERSAAPEPAQKHKCWLPDVIDLRDMRARGVPAPEGPDLGAGTVWRCDECGEKWTLDWWELPWRNLLVFPFVILANFFTLGVLMRFGKSSRWRSATSVKWFVSSNLALCAVLIVYMVTSIAVYYAP